MTHDAFDLRPDPELGHLLREHLGGANPAAFGARLRAAVAASAESPWDVLAGWVRPGLAAAAALLLALALLGRTLAAPERVASAGDGDLAEALVLAEAPSPDAVLGAALEEGR